MLGTFVILTQAFLLIIFSELGDTSFLLAALLAFMNYAGVVSIKTFGALAVMNVLSDVHGQSFHYVDESLPFRFGESDLPVDDIAAVYLLVYFGVSILLNANSGDLKAEDEQEEAELTVSEFSRDGAEILAAASTIASFFLLVSVAEWGDKSFFSTIALSAVSSPLSNGVATLLAVMGGSLLGIFISEKVIAYTGSVIFLVFAVTTQVEIVRGSSNTDNLLLDQVLFFYTGIVASISIDKRTGDHNERQHKRVTVRIKTYSYTMS